jgi:hypothetical protein
MCEENIEYADIQHFWPIDKQGADIKDNNKVTSVIEIKIHKLDKKPANVRQSAQFRLLILDLLGPKEHLPSDGEMGPDFTGTNVGKGNCDLIWSTINFLTVSRYHCGVEEKKYRP